MIPDSPDLHFGNDDFTLAIWIKIHACDARRISKEAFPEIAWQKGCAGSRTWIEPIRSTSIASGTAPPTTPAECHASPDP